MFHFHRWMLLLLPLTFTGTLYAEEPDVSAETAENPDAVVEGETTDEVTATVTEEGKQSDEATRNAPAAEPPAPDSELSDNPESEAKDASDPMSWEGLSDENKKILSKYATTWDDLNADRKQKLLKGVTRWKQMSPQEQAEVKKRVDHWNSADPAVKRKLYERRRWFSSLAPDQQDRLLSHVKRIRNMSADERSAIREKLSDMTPDQRLEYLDKNLQ